MVSRGGAKVTPRFAKMSQDGGKMSQDGGKVSQDDVKMTPRCGKISQHVANINLNPYAFQLSASPKRPALSEK